MRIIKTALNKVWFEILGSGWWPRVKISCIIIRLFQSQPSRARQTLSLQHILRIVKTRMRVLRVISLNSLPAWHRILLLALSSTLQNGECEQRNKRMLVPYWKLKQVCIEIYFMASVKVTKRFEGNQSNEVKSKFSSLECDLTSNFIPTSGANGVRPEQKLAWLKSFVVIKGALKSYNRTKRDQ